MAKKFSEKRMLIILVLIHLFPLIHINAQSSSWKQMGVGGGGTMLTYYCDKDNPQKLYVGSDVAGVWLSENSGGEYKYITRDWKAEYVQCIKKHPSQEKLYVGCSTGVFSTPDDGETWDLVFPAVYISEFYIYQENGEDIIYAITGKTRVPDQGEEILGDNKFYRYNYGESGLLESFPINQSIGGNSFDLEVNPNNPQEIWVSSNQGVYYSTDAGSSFSDKTGDLPLGNITSMISNPNNFEEKIATNYTQGVFKRISGFDIWTNITGNMIDNNQFSSVFNDPTGALWGEKIFVAHADGNLNMGLWHSSDGGNNWETKVALDNTLMGWASGNKIASHSKGTFLNEDNELYMGRSGNIFKCTNPQSENFTWEQVYTNNVGNDYFTNRGLVNTVARNIAFNPYKKGELWIIESDRLIWKSIDNGETFKQVSNLNSPIGTEPKDAFSVVFSPTDSNLVLASLSEGYGQSTGTGALYRSIDGGNNFNEINTWESSDILQLSYNAEGTKLYAAMKGLTNGIYSSSNNGGAWDPVAWTSNKVSYVSTHPYSNNIIFVGCSDAGPPNRGLQKGVKTGNIWQFTKVIHGEQCNDVVYSSQNPDVMYAAMGTGGVYKSTDGGNTWGKILETNNGSGCRKLTIDPSNGELYATSEGNDYGDLLGGERTSIKKTADGGNTWEDITQDFPSMPIWAMQYVEHPEGDYLIIATKGLGAWKLNLESENASTSLSENTTNKLTIYPNPANEYFSIKLSDVSMRYYTFTLYSATGEKIDEKELDNSYINYSTKSLASGIYLVEILYDGKRINQKLIVN
jgi:Secretion system C-terminal sorting domain